MWLEKAAFMKIATAMFILCVCLCGCSYNKEQEVDFKEQYGSIPTGYDETNWCMSQQEVVELLNADLSNIVSDDELVFNNSYIGKNDILDDFYILFGAPDVTYRFGDDMLYEIELKCDLSYSQHNYKNFINFVEWLETYYTKTYYDETHDEDYNKTTACASFSIDVHGTDITLIYVEVGDPQMNELLDDGGVISLIYSNDKLYELEYDGDDREDEF